MMTYKIGDAVFIRIGNLMEHAVVERLTATQVIASGRRFMIKNGYEVGYADWIAPQIMLATPELIEKQNQIRLDVHVKAQMIGLINHLHSLRGPNAMKAYEILRNDIEQIMAIAVTK